MGLSALAADWTRFRGPDGMGVSVEKGVPIEWSEQKNIVWRTKLPGPGTSSPITLGNRVFLTCYSGYGLEPGAGDMNKLMRHVLCVDRKSGAIVWQKDFSPALPESQYTAGNNSRHGYASSTPVSDGERLYLFFGKSGVYCLDLDGKELWHASVGTSATGWGSATSPVLYKDLVIINASVESNSLLALDRKTGKEVWRAEKNRSSWNTPLLVDVSGGKTELVLCAGAAVKAFDPDTGSPLWHSNVFESYICPSVVAHQGIIYANPRSTAAIRAGGRGDVTDTHLVWKTNKGTVVSSPLYHNGHLYFARDGGQAYCLKASTGEVVYQERLSPAPQVIYASPILADGKIYYVTQQHGTYVVAAEPKFHQLAHNVFADDKSRTNASPVISNGQLLLRTDAFLYCIGTKNGAR
jgi:outer membrane protein assembly factor BamB